MNPGPIDILTATIDELASFLETYRSKVTSVAIVPVGYRVCVEREDGASVEATAHSLPDALRMAVRAFGFPGVTG